MTLPATTAILTNPETITTSGTSASFTISPALNEVIVSIDVTAVSGTNPECDFYVDESPDGGTTWQPVGIGAPVARAAGVQTFIAHVGAMLATARLRWVVSGTTPSFTVSATKYP